ncbi:MAG: VOC family protein [Candidatus Promineifilaceae bacterium]
MTNAKLPPDIQMGSVHLTVSNLDQSIDFYRRSIGMDLIDRQDNQASLGTVDRELLHLVEIPGAVKVPRRTGLYHFALLLPSRQDLGDVLRNFVDTQTRITGGADHLVSEAIYLDDPEGNGIESYRDRPREEWQFSGGMVQMDTLPLDFEGLLNQTGSRDSGTYALPMETTMGHVHLHVADLARAVDFYQNVIGLDLVAQYGNSASFLSAGGYHHHLGLNTWAGVGVPPLPEGSVGLRYYTIILPDTAALDALNGRLQQAKIALEYEGEGFFVRDPSQNQLLLISQ